MTPSEAVIFRSQIVESYRRYITLTQHKVKNADSRGAAAAEYQALLAAPLYTWRQDLLDAAYSAAQGLPAPVTFSQNLRPSESGLYLFEKAIRIQDCAKPITAVLWSALTETHTLFWAYIDTTGTTWRDMGPVGAYAVFGLSDGCNALMTGPGVYDAREVQRETDWPRTSSDALMRFMLASWLWLGQKVVRVDRPDVSRAARKCAARQTVNSSVNVVVLRRSDTSRDNPEHQSHIEYSCQWLVRGHWRKQYYPSSGEHRPLWIEPHIKGPEDKPLKPPTETVYSVSR